MVYPWANGSKVGEEWATRSHWQLSEPGEYGDLKLEPWAVRSSPEIWNNSPMKANDMDFQPIKYIQYITTTYTRYVVLETRQFSEFPTSELQVWWVFWSWDGWGNESMSFIGCISYSKSEMEISEWIWEEISEGTSKASEND